MSPNLFVFGIARSGTNLVARMLDAHPAVAVALDPLLPLFKAWRNAILAALDSPVEGALSDPEAPFQDGYFSPDGHRAVAAVLGGSADLRVEPGEMEGLRAAVRERARLESASLPQRFAGWTGATYRDLFVTAAGAIRGSRDTETRLSWVGSKEVWTVEFAAPLARAFPEARFVLVERDPRAIVSSLLALARRDESQAAHLVSYLRHWRKQVAVTERLQGDPALQGRLLRIGFEELVRRPEAVAHRACGFLSLPFAKAMLEPRGEVGAAWTGNSAFGELQGISSATAARWRGTLPEATRRTVEYHCGPEMRLTRYAPLDPEPGRLTGDVLATVEAAHRSPGSWRSDSGDSCADTAWEALRWSLLELDEEPPVDLMRRCFLFEDVGGMLRQSPSRSATSEARE